MTATTPGGAPAAAEPDLRYPVGRFAAPTEFTPELRERWIAEIAGVPAALRDAVAGLDDARLDTPYRPGGWTVRQVVHHVPDSHMHAYARVKLALTEDAPVIKPYDEARWAALPDAREPIDASLALLDALHRRWTALLRALGPDDWSRGFVHPDHERTISVELATAMYAWHGRHHVAHVASLRARMGW